MRFTYLIRRINGWFGGVVYERDEWDATIESWRGADYAPIAFMVGCTSFSVWFSRRVLWVLMTLGHAISAVLLRQMEYDADRVEMCVARSAAFESTMLKLAALGSVMSEIQREMRRAWRTKFQLPDNLPVLMEYRAALLSPAQRQKFENQSVLGKTGLLDTHPSVADRVCRARQFAAPGLDLSDEPARKLFENFDTASRLVTLAHYEDDLNVPVTPELLIPLEQIIKSQTEPAPSTAFNDRRACSDDGIRSECLSGRATWKTVRRWMSLRSRDRNRLRRIVLP